MKITFKYAYVDHNITLEKIGRYISLFDEIKKRSADDILSQIKTSLAKKLKNKFDLSAISIEINPTWCVESELDYVF